MAVDPRTGYIKALQGVKILKTMNLIVAYKQNVNQAHRLNLLYI